MDFEFDKEIDVLLRQARKGKIVFASALPQSAHLDADELSAFAENALPEKAKQLYTVHLAECDSCRKFLSGLISINSENEFETVHAPEQIVAASPVIPWYRKLFALPNLAYTMGALVVLFGGIIGFMVLQNSGNLQNSEVAKVNEKPQTAEQMPPANAVATPESDSNSAAANTSNETVYSSNSMMQSAPANSNMSSVAATQPQDSPAMPKTSEPLSESDLAAVKKDKENFSLDGAENEQKDKGLVNGVAVGRRNTRTQEDTRAENLSDQTVAAPLPSVSNNQVAELPVNGRQTNDLKLSPAAKSAPKKERSKASEGETSNVGGKNFNRTNNVWYDTNYKQQPTTNITRGTEKYKKLDKDLRSIVENLGGTVVVFWKDKAYRIQ